MQIDFQQRQQKPVCCSSKKRSRNSPENFCPYFHCPELKYWERKLCKAGVRKLWIEVSEPWQFAPKHFPSWDWAVQMSKSALKIVHTYLWIWVRVTTGRENSRSLNIISISFMHGFMSFKANKQKTFYENS